MINPYNDAKELTPFKWMWKFHKKKMVFFFFFTSIFIFVPWIGEARIEEDFARWGVSIFGALLNVIGTFLYPYSIYKSNVDGWKRWQDNYESGAYDPKPKK